MEEDGLVILQRRIMPQRSISKVNGETVNAKLLKELSGVLIDIHGQHDSQQLLQSKKHLEILDDFAGEEITSIKKEIKEKYHIYRKLQEQLKETNLDEREKERELSLARFELEEIESASLKEGEDEELENSYRKLSNSRKIAEVLNNVHSLTGYESDCGAGGAAGRALRELNSVSAVSYTHLDVYKRQPFRNPGRTAHPADKTPEQCRKPQDLSPRERRKTEPTGLPRGCGLRSPLKPAMPTAFWTKKKNPSISRCCSPSQASLRKRSLPH